MLGEFWNVLTNAWDRDEFEGDENDEADKATLALEDGYADDGRGDGQVDHEQVDGGDGDEHHKVHDKALGGAVADDYASDGIIANAHDANDSMSEMVPQDEETQEESPTGGIVALSDEEGASQDMALHDQLLGLGLKQAGLEFEKPTGSLPPSVRLCETEQVASTASPVPGTMALEKEPEPTAKVLATEPDQLQEERRRQVLGRMAVVRRGFFWGISPNFK